MATTDDAFLGGKLKILQPRQGYRAGVDAVMLAAAVASGGESPQLVLDVGAGVGTAGLCVARRCPSVTVVLLEREPSLVELARQNVTRNCLSDRVSVVAADLMRLPSTELSALGLAEGQFDHVIANPPYHTEGDGTAAGYAEKARAHAMPEDGLEGWCRFLARMARPGGEALVIHKTAALPDLIAALGGRFGGLQIIPLRSHAGEAAHRVILRGVKGSRAPLTIEPDILLHGHDERFTEGAERVLRHGQSLAVASGKTRNADAPA
jgi:tRNA1(Val) A37 N6-methylase TrmN6